MDKVTYIYEGRRLTNSGKLIYSYLDATTKKSSWYSKALVPIAIGGILECQKTEAGVKRPYDYMGKHENTTDLTKWVEIDWAAKKEYDLNKEMKRVPKTEYSNIIDRINLILVNLSPNQRKLFKMKLLMDLKG